MLGAFVLAGPDAGMLEVSIDGGEWKTVDLYHRYSKALNYPRSVILADGLNTAFHTAAIRVAEQKNEASKGHAVTLLNIAVTRCHTRFLGKLPRFVSLIAQDGNH